MRSGPWLVSPPVRPALARYVPFAEHVVLTDVIWLTIAWTKACWNLHDPTRGPVPRPTRQTRTSRRPSTTSNPPQPEPDELRAGPLSRRAPWAAGTDPSVP